jgi:serine/threonine protein phosphatase PrpC
MSNVKIRMAVRCEAAGRANNEDNYLSSDNLAGGAWRFTTDEVVPLGEKGVLLVVCDGMGGMNAGEVASATAVESVKEWFSPGRLGEEVTGSAEAITRHAREAIVAADARVKKEAWEDEEKEGMGTTIVLAWVIGESVFVGWCGDSRAYRFRPDDGLEQLSHDHSYVQELVDAGKLDPGLAFDHPLGNIITRSLGESTRAARPDVKEYPLRDGDILLLCSDGLCGVLRDREIEAVIRENQSSMEGCRDALWEAAREAGWHDNVTIGLCQVVSGREQQASTPRPVPASRGTRYLRKIIVFISLSLAVIFLAYCLMPREKEEQSPYIPPQVTAPPATDSTNNEQRTDGDIIRDQGRESSVEGQGSEV